MTFWRCCLATRQLIFVLLITLSSTWTRASAPSCETQFLDKTYREEVKKLWDEMEEQKKKGDKALKRKSRELIRAIKNHAYANDLFLEVDPKNSAALLIKILPDDDLISAHPLNRFATKFFRIHGIRIEISPLKLAFDDAGALFDEKTNRLTFALDNVLDLKLDSFVMHEMKHAFSTYLERMGIEHVFFGWIKRKQRTPILHETYPDTFSFDELPAYYYQVFDLLREAKKNPEELKTVLQFTNSGLDLLGHITSQEVVQHTQSSPKSRINRSGEEISVIIETNRYELDFRFFKKPERTDQELQALAFARLNELTLKAQEMEVQLEKVKELLEGGNYSIDEAIAIMKEKISAARRLMPKRQDGQFLGSP